MEMMLKLAATEKAKPAKLSILSNLTTLNLKKKRFRKNDEEIACAKSGSSYFQEDPKQKTETNTKKKRAPQVRDQIAETVRVSSSAVSYFKMIDNTGVNNLLQTPLSRVDGGRNRRSDITCGQCCPDVGPC